MKAIEFLKAHQSKTPSNWREEAEYRRKNSRWLRYSAMIALRVLDRMDEIGITQAGLAEKMGCTQQHISMLVKGKNNLTLETISKLEEALGIDIIGAALVPPSYTTRESKFRYLSEDEQAPYGAKRGADEERMEEDER